MDEFRSSAALSLIQPIEASKVLIKGEKPHYDERLHWAALVLPFFETLGALTMITVGTAPGRGQISLGILVAGGLYIYQRWGLPAHKSASSKWTYAFFGAAVAAAVVTGNTLLAVALIFAVTGRFVLRFVEWMWYERLFITNRRLILAKGLLGEDYSTMPLTRLTDINYNTTVPGEFLGYATVRVETAGQDQALSYLNFLTNPADFYEKLINLSTAAVGSITNVDPDADELLDRPDGA